MKYLYQQLLAFGGLILLILLTLGVTFTQFTRHSMEESNYNQLIGYTRSIEKTARELSDQYPYVNEDEAFLRAVGLTENMLEPQNVRFVFISSDQIIRYPGNTKVAEQSLITKSQWKELSQGQEQKITRATDIYGNKSSTSYAMAPFFKSEVFYGVLIVTQPAGNVSDSVASVTSDLFKGFIVASVVAIFVSYFFATRQVKRINRMRSATKKIASGDFDVTIPNKGKDEFDDLADDFNSMTVSLKESQEEIERQEERRRQFMADAAHEMRTPLTTINGLLEGLQYNAIPENQRSKAISLMQNETARLIRLVNENLDYEKIRTNQISMIVKKFDATKALRGLLTQLDAKAQASGDQLILTTNESIDVYADYDRFIQIMVNIIQNAIQFTTDGTITIGVHKEEKKTIVQISDTGIGMSEDQVKNIWDRYYKVDPSRKNTKYGESGLGLSIVQELVRLHKGTIQVESELEKGTTFTISFPDEEVEEQTETERP
ncbi:sensor histidine kinase [Enterococcus pallens]|uniref:histidine kinase n=1 Tax=Enterococcus pallens ATCC BAA-351 TaxID=1158607 RepID=R2SUD7_9ENTE|nr:HAMP domain-containing sensor histidine kinase [Enterococcus pallens]EOH96411.1 two-component system sensor histidine kinase [Enterococcus pallens ATCC BAA-351]EOU14376.1 two-component system sensor histidine kinase [Enterococcus pallens ATCC BAA-351]